MQIACYFDFTCGYSYRAWRWFERLRESGVDVDIEWRGFVLKEVNRGPEDPSLLAGEQIQSVAVLALAFAAAVPEQALASYRGAIFNVMHANQVRATRDDVLRIASDSGVDLDAFWRDEGTWLEKVRDGHVAAVMRWGVFGTPTLIFDDWAPMYMKLAALPQADDAKLWESLTTVSHSFPELAELKRPFPSR